MDARSVALVQQSFEKVVALGDEAAKIFYVELFAIDPSLRTMFKGDMAEQHRKLPDKVGEIIEEIRGPAGRTMWDKLNNVSETVLANYLRNEYPQTVAVILSKLRPNRASGVLAALPQDFALDVVERMLRMQFVQKDILEEVERTLRIEFMSSLARTAKRDAHEVMAEIFNKFDRQTENRFLTALDERERDSAERIRALMFTFEDLSKLDSASIQTLLRHIEKDKLATALKGATDTLRDMFFSNMSERAGKILREDLESLGPIRLKAVNDAHMGIVNVAKDLANRGEIMIVDKQGEDELVY